MPTYYKRDNTGTTDWNLSTSWSTVGSTSSTNSGTFPSSTTADPVIFDANSSDCTVNSINRTCTSITFAGYTNTITMSFNITVSGNITFGAIMQVHPVGSGILIMNASGTLTSNGFVWPKEFRFNGTSQTFTIASDMTFGGVLSTTGAVTAVNLAGSRTITCNSGVTATITIAGAGTTLRIAGGTTSGGFSTCDLVLYSGTIILGSISKGAASFIYTAGTVDATGSSLSLSGAVTVSLGSNVVFNSCTMSTGINITFNDDLWIAGNLSLSSAGNYSATFSTATSKRIYCWGLSGATNQNDPFAIASTKPTVVFNGTGAMDWGGPFGLPIIIDAGAGTLNFARTLTLGSVNVFQTTTYTSGNITATGTAATYIFSCLKTTLDMSGITLPSGVQSAVSGITGASVTLLSNLNFTGTLRITGTNVVPYNGAFIVNVGGGLLLDGSAGVLGSATIRLTGTGTWSTPTNPGFTMPIVIDTPSGSITLSGSVSHTGNLLYTTGNIISSGSTLFRGGTMTINSSSLTLNSLVCSANSIFTGSNGFDINNLTVNPGVNTVWGGGNTYNILQSLTSVDTQILNGTAPNRALFTGTNNAVFTARVFPATTLEVTSFIYGSGNLKAGDYVYTNGYSTPWLISSTGSAQGGVGNYTVVSNGVTVASRTFVDSGSGAPRPYVRLSTSATQNVLATNAVDVDSSQGQTIIVMPNQTVSGTYYYLQNATNWNPFTAPKTSGYTWVS
jgi:hypothetical protein